MNTHAQVTRLHPNADKLIDGAIQRASVSATSDELRYVSQNPKGLGSYKRAEQNSKCSAREKLWTNPWDGQRHRNKICRIYLPQKKHLHCHPTNKQIGKYWAIDFPNTGSFKSNLMGWGRQYDPYALLCNPYQTNAMHMKFGKLSDAVAFTESMGWGYDVSHPKYRYHVKKNYADNFKFKGHPAVVPEYD
jgi:hypothetical protein